MSPIRLIIIGILLYIGYLLIKGGRVDKQRKDRKKSEIDGPDDVSDVLVEDPVCKKLVPKNQAVTVEHEGERRYFCSDECCKTFVSEKGAEQ